MTRPSVVPLKKLPDKDPFQFVALKDVEVKPINWIWKPYIPRGALTLIMGDGGYGKSWMTCAIAADLSQGRALPEQDAMPPQKILMVSAEDGISQVIKPKMELLGANMDNIMASDKGFTLDASAMTHLVNYIKEYDVAIVFFDPLVVYMGGKIDINRANEARSLMTLLVDVAQNTDTAIVAVHHVRKSGEGALQHKVMGSADFINGVRSGLLVEVAKGGQRFMAHVKSNWAANGSTLAYKFGSQGFEWQGRYDNPVADEPTPKPSIHRRGEIEDWLRASLRDGERPAQEMLLEAESRGYAERTLHRAKAVVVRAYNQKGMWWWALKDEEIAEMQRKELYITTTPAQDVLQQLGRGPIAPAPVQQPGETAVDYARRVMARRGGEAS